MNFPGVNACRLPQQVGDILCGGIPQDGTIRQQDMAIDMADVILFMVNVRDGMTAADKEVAAMLQKCGRPVLLVCNKVDNPGNPPMEMYEFYNLGVGDPYPVSSVHGLGLGDLLDVVVSFFPKEQEGQEEEESIHVAIVGKPNAGKSSLVNRILGENRVIVSLSLIHI